MDFHTSNDSHFLQHTDSPTLISDIFDVEDDLHFLRSLKDSEVLLDGISGKAESLALSASACWRFGILQ